MIFNIIVSIIIFLCNLKTFFYGLYEIKEKNNTLGGSFVIFISTVGLIIPIIFIYM